MGRRRRSWRPFPEHGIWFRPGRPHELRTTCRLVGTYGFWGGPIGDCIGFRAGPKGDDVGFWGGPMGDSIGFGGNLLRDILRIYSRAHIPHFGLRKHAGV